MAIKNIRICAIAGCLLLLLQINAHCFNISPTKIEINTAPSKGYDGVLIVKNTEKTDMYVKLRTEDWLKAREEVKKTEAGKLNWLEVNPLEFELKEGEEKKISLVVTIPKGTSGELNGMIFVEGRPQTIKEGSITINTSIGIPIYVIIAGTEKIKADIEDLKIVNRAPLKFELRIKNSGNVHIRPDGVIEMKAKDNKRLFDLPLNEYNYPILPNSSRTLEIMSNYKLEAGEYIADIKMGFSDRHVSKKITLKTR